MFQQPQRKKPPEKGQITVSITGTVFIALALITIIGIATGLALNQIQPGLGSPLIWIGIISFIILVVFAFLYWASEQQGGYR